MAGFTDPNSQYWQSTPNHQSYDFDTTGGFSDVPSQQLDFQTFSGQQSYNQSYGNQQYDQQQQYYNPNIFTPSTVPEIEGQLPDEFDEKPLLEELEIYPERILEKTLAVLNPFHTHSQVDSAEYLLSENDIAGPVAFCITLAIFLFISGNKAQFGYVYGLSMFSVFLMYFLLSLMTSGDGVFTVLSVASILGYCLLPMVVLAGIGVFLPLNNGIGFIITGSAVVWSALSASRLFVTMSGETEQRLLIAYPCALVNGVFALLVLF